MAIGTPVDQGHAQNASATSLNITTLANVAIGDAIFLCHGTGTSSRNITSVTDPAGNTWVIANGNAAATANEIWWCSYSIAAFASSSTITANFTGAAASHGVSAFSVSGMNRPALDKTPSTNTWASATTVTPTTTGTLSKPVELAVVSFCGGGTDPGTITAAGGVTTAIGGTTATVFVKPFYGTTNATTALLGTAWTWVNADTGRIVSATFSMGTSGAGGMLMLGVG